MSATPWRSTPGDDVRDRARFGRTMRKLEPNAPESAIRAQPVPPTQPHNARQRRAAPGAPKRRVGDSTGASASRGTRGNPWASRIRVTNAQVERLLEEDSRFSRVVLRGQLSNLSRELAVLLEEAQVVQKAARAAKRRLPRNPSEGSLLSSGRDRAPRLQATTSAPPPLE